MVVNNIDGGNGADFITAGNDVIVGGRCDDTIHAKNGDNNIDGGNGADLITACYDVIDGGKGEYTIYAGSGNDIILMMML